jgi:hypothetical protein
MTINRLQITLTLSGEAAEVRRVARVLRYTLDNPDEWDVTPDVVATWTEALAVGEVATFESLTAEFGAWISQPAQAAFVGAGDALEIRMFAELTMPQARWLDAFLVRWNEMEARREAYAPEEDASLKAAWDQA